jgi:hypothetical protein
LAPTREVGAYARVGAYGSFKKTRLSATDITSFLEVVFCSWQSNDGHICRTAASKHGIADSDTIGNQKNEQKIICRQQTKK